MRRSRVLAVAVSLVATGWMAAPASALTLNLQPVATVNVSSPFLGDLLSGTQTLLSDTVNAVTTTTCSLVDNETVCLLNILSYRVVTDYERPDNTHVVRVTGGVINLPTLVDASGDGVPDVQVLIQAITPSNIKMTITRLLTAPASFPLSVEALVNDPSTPKRVINVGYDARDTSAPKKWTAQASLTTGATVAVKAALTVEEPPSAMSVVGGLFTEGPGLARLNPKQARLTYTPVPAVTNLAFSIAPAVSTGTVSTSSSTTADLDLLLLDGTSGRHVHATLDKLNKPVGVLLDKVEGNTHVRVTTFNDVAQAALLYETIVESQVHQRVRLATGALPGQTDFTQTPDGFVADTDTPVDVAGGVSSGQPVPDDYPLESDEASYVHQDTKNEVDSTTFRVAGVTHAAVATTGPPENRKIAIGARLETAPLHVLVTNDAQPGGTRYDATVKDMPHNLYVAIAPGQKRMVDFCGSSNDAPDPCSDEGQAAAQGIDSITLAESYAPEAIIGRATHINGKLEGIPSTLGVDVEAHAPKPGDPDPNTKVHIDTTRAIGETVLRAHDGSPLPDDPIDNGIVYRDTLTDYSVVAKVTGFRRAYLDVEPERALALQLRAAGGHDLSYDVELKDGTRADGGLPNRPARTEVSLTTPEDAPTVLAIRGANAVGALQETPKLTLNLSRPKIFGRVKKLAADVTDIPPVVDLTVDTRVPEADDPDQSTKVHIDADHAIGHVLLRASDGQPFPGAPADNGVVYRETKDDYAIVAKVTGFLRAHLDTDPTLKDPQVALELRAAGAHDFTYDIVRHDQHIHGDLPDRPAVTTVSLATPEGKPTVLEISGKTASDAPADTPKLRFTMTQVDEPIFGKAKLLVADVTDIPAEVGITIDTDIPKPDDPPDQNTRVHIDADHRIGHTIIRATDGEAPPDDPTDNGVVYRDTDEQWAVVAKVDGFRRAHLDTEPKLDLVLRADGGHDLNYDIDLGDKQITGTVFDRPHFTQVTFAAAKCQPMVLTLTGKDALAFPAVTPRIELLLVQDEPVFGDATRIEAKADDVPANEVLTVDTHIPTDGCDPDDPNTKVHIDAVPPLPHAEFSATDGVVLPMPQDNGVVYQDQPGKPYAILAEVDGFASAHLDTVPDIHVTLTAEGGHDFSFGIHLPSAGEFKPPKDITGVLENRPATTDFSFATAPLGAMTVHLDGFDADDTPADHPRITVDARNLSSDPAEKVWNVHADLQGVPPAVDLVKHPAADGGINIDANTGGDPIDSVLVQLDQGFDFDPPELPAGSGAAFVFKEPFIVWAKVLHLRQIKLTAQGQLDATLDVAEPQDFRVYVNAGLGPDNKIDTKGCDKFDPEEHTAAHTVYHDVFIKGLRPHTTFRYRDGLEGEDPCRSWRTIAYDAEGRADSVSYRTTAGDLQVLEATVGQQGDNPLKVPETLDVCHAMSDKCFDLIGRHHDCGLAYCRMSSAVMSAYADAHHQKTHMSLDLCLVSQDPDDYSSCTRSGVNKGVFVDANFANIDIGYNYEILPGVGFLAVNTQPHALDGVTPTGENQGVNGFVRYVNHLRVLEYANANFGYTGGPAWDPASTTRFNNHWVHVFGAIPIAFDGSAVCANTEYVGNGEADESWFHAILNTEGNSEDDIGNNLTHALCGFP